jgi:hypothetical protein
VPFDVLSCAKYNQDAAGTDSYNMNMSESRSILLDTATKFRDAREFFMNSALNAVVHDFHVNFAA